MEHPPLPAYFEQTEYHYEGFSIRHALLEPKWYVYSKAGCLTHFPTLEEAKAFIDTFDAQAWG